MQKRNAKRFDKIDKGINAIAASLKVPKPRGTPHSQCPTLTCAMVTWQELKRNQPNSSIQEALQSLRTTVDALASPPTLTTRPTP